MGKAIGALENFPHAKSEKNCQKPRGTRDEAFRFARMMPLWAVCVVLVLGTWYLSDPS